MSVTPAQFELLQQLMDAAGLRQKTLGQNVANVNTPGYRRLDVAFEEQLAQQLIHNNELAVDVEPKVIHTLGLAERADGNNVDIDMEMGQLSKNALLYQTYAQILTSKLSMMRSAITGQ